MIAILVVLSLVFIPEARSTVWLAIPLAAVFVGLVAGVGLIAACLNVLYRDVEHLIAAALLPWFFLTPILWRFAQLPERVQSHHALLNLLRWGNPITPPIYAVRDALWLGQAPRLADVVYLLVAAGWRSCSARSCSAASTIGSLSNSEHDPSIPDPRLVGRRRVRR